MELYEEIFIKRKYLAVGIILLFVGTSIIPAIAQDIEQTAQQIENPDKSIAPFLSYKFIFGKVSNVRCGGYTPAYWFHIDKVMIFAHNQVPKLQWIEDCECNMLSMNFRGFIFRGKTIIGLVSDLFIYE